MFVYNFHELFFKILFAKEMDYPRVGNLRLAGQIRPPDTVYPAPCNKFYHE